MEQIFLKVLNMSLMASWVILVLLLLRPLLKKAPGWISAGLWLVALLRLLCPVSFESPFTLMRIRSQSIPSDIAMNRVPQIESGSAILDNAVNNALENPAFTPNDGGSVNPLQIWIWLAAWIWLLGILVMVVYSAVSLYRLHRRMKGAVPLRDTAPLQQDVAGMLPDAGNRVFICSHLETAFVVGLARPKIYLPSGLGEEERAYVLFHEKTHIKRKDHLVKALAFAALCIHWFNPLAWAAFHMTGRDMERACDEAVLRKMGSDTQLKKAYSQSLLRLAAGRRNTCGTPIAFGEGEVKSRVKNVLQYKKPAAWAVAVIAVLCLALAFGLLTNRADEKVNLDTAITKDVRNMGFPSLIAVPDGFSLSDAKSMDTGDWCEIIYENASGDFLSLDCYKAGTFDASFLTNYAKSAERMSLNDNEATVYRGILGNDNIHVIAWEDGSNNALCLLGGNISLEEMFQAAESIQYDMKKVVATAENTEISSSPKDRGTIEEEYLKKYSDVLEYVTTPLFNQYLENDKAISEFELESFFKSFEFPAADGLSVEVFDYDYIMKANENVQLLGGMSRDEDGNIRGFNGYFGQIAAISRDGKLIKVVPVTDMDVKLEPEGADEETLEWIKGKVMTAVKSPWYLMRNMWIQ